MNIYLKRCVPRNPYAAIIYRMLGSSEVATALRPFYFAVHPDLFGRYPQERQVNEDSLKQLSAHLESLLSQRRVLPSTPKILPFYVRASNAPEHRGTFKLVKVPLERTTDTKLVLRKILESCNLSTEYVEKMVATSSSSSSRGQKSRSNSSGSGGGGGQTYRRRAEQAEESPFESEFDIFQFRVKKARENESLKYWLRKHLVTASVRMRALQEMKDEDEKLRESMVKLLGAKDIVYDCGWNAEHFGGCLKSLERLVALHPKAIAGVKDRVVVFASFTGVSLDGHIMLFTGDVQENWLDGLRSIEYHNHRSQRPESHNQEEEITRFIENLWLLQNVEKHDAYLRKLPAYEHALSQVLRNIRVGRRKFMPKAQAMAYASHLRKITTSLLDYLSKSKYPKSWPTDLSQFEIVVESEAGPLMVSPTGQLIVPATCPGVLLVDFLTNHLEESLHKQQSYNLHKYVERDLHARCVQQFRLLSLNKDDSVTPDRMIECLEKLLTEAGGFELADIHLNITTYYSVLTDGTVCIPWDWK